MDRVDAYIVGNWRRQARFKLQDDAVATSILGRLCEQFPEVFQTHVMPHLQDADLRSLIVLLGSVPRRAIRALSGVEEVVTSRLSRLDWFARVPRVEPAQSAQSIGCAAWVARPVTRWRRSLLSCITCTFEENLYRARQARVDAAAKSIALNDGRLIVYGQIHKTQRAVITGRIYPGHILEREVGVYYGRHVIHQRALGEFHHPAPTSNTFRSLRAANVSHQILDCHWEGDLLMAYVEILDTTAGNMARDRIVAGIELWCAARGWATLGWRDGEIYVHEDYELITFDLDLGSPLLTPLQRRYENLQPPLTNRLIEQAIASFKREMKFQALDRFVGVNPDGRAYCKMCRLKNGRDFGKTNLTTLPALRGHAERAVFRSGPCARRYLRLPPEAHGEMCDAIDAVLCRSS